MQQVLLSNSVVRLSRKKESAEYARSKPGTKIQLTIFLSTMFQCTEKIPFPVRDDHSRDKKTRILCRKRDQGQSVPVRSDFSSNIVEYF